MNKNRCRILCCFVLTVLMLASLPIGAFPEDELAAVKKAIDSGRFAYRITEAEDIRSLLGPPDRETEAGDGGMLTLEMVYGELIVRLGKMRDSKGPFTLRRILYKDEDLALGRDKPVVLRGNHDLNKVERFWGLQNISLIHVDLRQQEEWLETMTFDTLTIWPQRDKLPVGFDPGKILEEGKNPGLGLRALHESGIDGRGVGIAVIDQPLLLGHEEYSHRIVHYDASGLAGMDPQMHASPVASIAVGKTVGVAPGAVLHFYAVPMWERKNESYIRALKDIIRRNLSLPEGERVRAVSISTGTFASYPRHEEWEGVLKEAEAAGIFVMTCDREHFSYATLSHINGRSYDDLQGWRRGYYGVEKPVLMIPTGNRTIASHRGIDVYTFERMGGMSWAAPYAAGLAALAFQVNPQLDPGKVWDYLVRTAVRTEAGPVINPRGFIAFVKKLK